MRAETAAQSSAVPVIVAACERRHTRDGLNFLNFQIGRGAA